MGGERLRNVRTLAELYDVVTDSFLEREKHARKMGVLDPRTMRIALSRLALVILARGSTRLNLVASEPGDVEDELNAMFQEPEDTLDALLPGGRKWIDRYWRSGVYVTRPLPPFLDREAGRGLGEP